MCKYAFNFPQSSCESSSVSDIVVSVSGVNVLGNGNCSHRTVGMFKLSQKKDIGSFSKIL